MRDWLVNVFIMIWFSLYSSIPACRWALIVSAINTNSLPPTAGTISGEEVPIVSKTNIKEYRDSFSCEKFTFRNNPNITFYVYVSNFSWPIKIQVRIVLFRIMSFVFFTSHETSRTCREPEQPSLWCMVISSALYSNDTFNEHWLLCMGAQMF